MFISMWQKNLDFQVSFEDRFYIAYGVKFSLDLKLKLNSMIKNVVTLLE